MEPLAFICRLKVPKIGASVKALVDLTPTGSHVVLGILSVIFGLCVFTSFLFIYLAINFWLPLLVGIAGIIMVCGMWNTSHKGIDNRGAPPVNFHYKNDSGSMTLSMPSESIPPKDFMESLESLLPMVRLRSHLPEPDGLIDGKGEPIPNSQNEAKERVQFANTQADEIREEVYSWTRDQKTEGVPQPVLDYEPGTDVSHMGNFVGKPNEAESSEGEGN